MEALCSSRLTSSTDHASAVAAAKLGDFCCGCIIARPPPAPPGPDLGLDELRLGVSDAVNKDDELRLVQDRRSVGCKQRQGRRLTRLGDKEDVRREGLLRRRGKEGSRKARFGQERGDEEPHLGGFCKGCAWESVSVMFLCEEGACAGMNLRAESTFGDALEPSCCRGDRASLALAPSRRPHELGGERTTCCMGSSSRSITGMATPDGRRPCEVTRATATGAGTRAGDTRVGGTEVRPFLAIGRLGRMRVGYG
jgi:hypothetical protein